MESTSASARAHALLEHCLNGSPWPASLLESLLDGDDSRALFAVVVERLGDLFEPRLCHAYAELFSEAIARKVEGLHASHLLGRYRRVRAQRRFEGEPARVRNVFVLSRVTLGADAAITSVMLDGALRAFPGAEVFFTGPVKNWELFEGHKRIGHLPVSYGRGGTLEERLAVWPRLRESLSRPASVVIDPDSRLTQLGLLPVCPEEDYFFFESRAYGGDGGDSLGALARRWVRETFGVEARAFLSPRPAVGPPPCVAVSLGVGENPAKRVGDPFEERLLAHLAGLGAPMLVDRGAGGEEAERVVRAVRGLRGGVRTWDGGFAGFAAEIARSKLFVGYDSAGGHVAAACGVPAVSVFSGFASERMLARWRPSGDGPVRVVCAEGLPPDIVWSMTRDAVDELWKAGAR